MAFAWPDGMVQLDQYEGVGIVAPEAVRRRTDEELVEREGETLPPRIERAVVLRSQLGALRFEGDLRHRDFSTLASQGLVPAGWCTDLHFVFQAWGTDQDWCPGVLVVLQPFPVFGLLPPSRRLQAPVFVLLVVDECMHGLLPPSRRLESLPPPMVYVGGQRRHTTREWRMWGYRLRAWARDLGCNLQATFPVLAPTSLLYSEPLHPEEFAAGPHPFRYADLALLPPEAVLFT
jgi:hypothetical protein